MSTPSRAAEPSVAAEPSIADVPRRNMRAVWWSTYGCLVFLLIFCQVTWLAGGTAAAHRSGGLDAWGVLAVVLTFSSLLLWCVAIRVVRHGTEALRLRDPWFVASALTGGLGFVAAVLSPVAVGAGILPATVLLCSVGLTVTTGRWWVLALAVLVGPAHVWLGSVLGTQPNALALIPTAAWISFFVVLAIASSLWIWSLMVAMDRMRRRSAQLAVTNERLRFAAQLHDIQGHHLQVVSLTTDLAARLLEKGRVQDALGRVREAHDAAQSALRETRAVVHGYRFTTLSQELDNAAAVLRSAGVRTRADLPELVADGLSLPCARDVNELLGLVVREATTNILRHSQASNASLLLSLEHGAEVASHGAENAARTSDGVWVRLCIGNDGIRGVVGTTAGEGSPELSEAHSTGLVALGERVRQLGGSLEHGPRGPRDYVLLVTVPVPSAEAPSDPGDAQAAPGVVGTQPARRRYRSQGSQT